MNKTCYNNILLPPTPAPSPGAFAPAQCLSLLLKVEGNVASNSKQDLPQVQQMSNKTCTQALTDNGPRYGSKEHWGFPMVYWCLLSNLQPTRPNRHCSDWIRNKITSSQFKLMLPKQRNSVFFCLESWIIDWLKSRNLQHFFCWCRSTIERSDSKTRTNFISSNKHAKHVKPKGATKDQLWFRVGCRNTPKKKPQIAKLWSWNQHKA